MPHIKMNNTLYLKFNIYWRFIKIWLCSSNAAEEAEKTFYAMSQGIVDGKQNIKVNEKEKVVLQVKMENSKTKFGTLQIQVRKPFWKILLMICLLKVCASSLEILLI